MREPQVPAYTAEQEEQNKLKRAYLDGYYKGCQDTQKAASRWARCDERLPKDQSPVLVFVPPHEEYDDYYYGYVGMAYFTYSANGGFWCGTDGNLYGAVGMIHRPTHWMPLPEPPKEEK